MMKEEKFLCSLLQTMFINIKCLFFMPYSFVQDMGSELEFLQRHEVMWMKEMHRVRWQGVVGTAERGPARPELPIFQDQPKFNFLK